MVIFRNVRRAVLRGDSLRNNTEHEKMTSSIVKVLISFTRTASLEEIRLDESAWGRVCRIRKQLLWGWDFLIGMGFRDDRTVLPGKTCREIFLP